MSTQSKQGNKSKEITFVDSEGMPFELNAARNLFEYADKYLILKSNPDGEYSLVAICPSRCKAMSYVLKGEDNLCLLDPSDREIIAKTTKADGIQMHIIDMRSRIEKRSYVLQIR